MTVAEPRPLYPRLLRPVWSELHESVRGAHPAGARLSGRGRFRIRHGRGRAARLAGRLLRLPAAAESAAVELVVAPRGEGEDWVRSFAGQKLASRQSASADGRLVERLGPLEFHFDLEPEGGGIRYRQRAFRLRLGPLALPLPGRLAPRVDGLERPAGEAGHNRVTVSVSVPFLGRLLEYDGEIGFREVKR